MAKRPMCLLCFLMMLSLGTLELMGISLIRGNPLPLNVQEQIEAHPGSMICGEVEQHENTEFSQSVYLKKTYLIHQSKKIPIECKNIPQKRRRSETRNADTGQRNAEKSGRPCESWGL